MVDIDESYGISGPPFDDEDEPKPRPSWDDEIADAEAYYEGMMEERRMRREGGD